MSSNPEFSKSSYGSFWEYSKFNNELNIVYFAQLFRHGPRTPADTYPSDPHINETYHPYGWGQITNVRLKFIFNKTCITFMRCIFYDALKRRIK